MQLTALLIAPVQRIPRYLLFIRDLLKHTDKEHPDHKLLSNALEKVHTVAVAVDEGISRAERLNKVLSVQARIVAAPVWNRAPVADRKEVGFIMLPLLHLTPLAQNLLGPRRSFLCEGPLQLCKLESM